MHLGKSLFLNGQSSFEDGDVEVEDAVGALDVGVGHIGKEG